MALVIVETRRAPFPMRNDHIVKTCSAHSLPADQGILSVKQPGREKCPQTGA
jgi:hypothetical protein